MSRFAFAIVAFARFPGRKIGRATSTLPELLQTHVTIELSTPEKLGISEDFAEMYRGGLSLTDISKQCGKAKSTVLKALQHAGVEMRPNQKLTVSKALKTKAKGNIRPYYGFCYFQGRVVPDQREFENLTLIHQLWKSGTNPNRIADKLNTKKIPARSAAQWNRNSIVNILTRFEKGIVVLKKGGNYELN